MRTWAGICAVLVVTAAVLTGCLGTKTLPVPDPAEPTLFVDYQRSGGIAGMNDRLVIFDNGVALVSSRSTSREIQLNKSDLEQVSKVFTTARFMELEGNYTSLRGGADFMQYSIRYRGKTVNTEDTAIPPALEPVIEDLNNILSTGLSSGQGDLSLPRIGS
ncbi:MAG: hypothetical protein LUQ35_07605 [Methanoregula sp.]|jgi:hypothetical protein|nr:hypothetical protein [Methanoregula sp.]